MVMCNGAVSNCSSCQHIDNTKKQYKSQIVAGTDQKCFNPVKFHSFNMTSLVTLIQDSRSRNLESIIICLKASLTYIALMFTSPGQNAVNIFDTSVKCIC